LHGSNSHIRSQRSPFLACKAFTAIDFHQITLSYGRLRKLRNEEMRMRPIFRALISGMAAIGGANVAYAQGIEFGKDEYVRSCAACHGVTGKGDGPVAQSLNRSPGDLTKLAETNKGVFPVSRVYDAIDGRIAVIAHGTRDMPVWGELYPRELKYPGSTLSKETIEAMVRLRILALIEYISTLQGK
jgi:mono/diheme cytochrome c family protein